MRSTCPRSISSTSESATIRVGAGRRVDLSASPELVWSGVTDRRVDGTGKLVRESGCHAEEWSAPSDRLGVGWAALISGDRGSHDVLDAPWEADAMALFVRHVDQRVVWLIGNPYLVLCDPEKKMFVKLPKLVRQLGRLLFSPSGAKHVIGIEPGERVNVQRPDCVLGVPANHTMERPFVVIEELEMALKIPLRAPGVIVCLGVFRSKEIKQSVPEISLRQVCCPRRIEHRFELNQLRQQLRSAAPDCVDRADNELGEVAGGGNRCGNCGRREPFGPFGSQHPSNLAANALASRRSPQATRIRLTSYRISQRDQLLDDEPI